VKNTALLIKQANSGKDVSYDKYVQLLTHAASDYNNIQIKVKGKRQVYIHDIHDDTFDTYDDATSEYEPFDVDTPVDTIQAYALNYRPTSNRSDNNNQYTIYNIHLSLFLIIFALAGATRSGNHHIVIYPRALRRELDLTAGTVRF
jgi:hypothetical protein